MIVNAAGGLRMISPAAGPPQLKAVGRLHKQLPHKFSHHVQMGVKSGARIKKVAERGFDPRTFGL